MLRYLSPVLTGLLLVFSLAPLAAQDEWVLQKDADGVRIYTRFRSDSAIYEFKCVTQFTGDMDSAFAVLSDLSRISGTDPHTVESRMLHSVSANEYYFYQVMEMPIFKGQRDLVTHATIARTESGYFLYGVSTPDYIPRVEGVHRMEQVETRISVRKTSRSTFELIFWGSAAMPRENIPKALMNSISVNILKTRMRRMQELLGLPISEDQ